MTGSGDSVFGSLFYPKMDVVKLIILTNFQTLTLYFNIALYGSVRDLYRVKKKNYFDKKNCIHFQISHRLKNWDEPT